MALDADFAQKYIDSNTSPDAEPTLTHDEQDALLDAAKAIDKNGVSPGGSEYIETYTFDSLYGAIYLGWTWKLAKAAELHEGGEKVIFDHCERMLNFWAGRVSITTLNGLTSGSSTSVPNVFVW